MPLFTTEKTLHHQREADPENPKATLITRVVEVDPGWFSPDTKHVEVIRERETPGIFFGGTEELSRDRRNCES